jgi:hypothetical protein
MEIPTELWMLWDKTDETWVPSLDDDCGYLVFTDEKTANEAAEYHNKIYTGYDCCPVQVK